jgi:hypothetical protein
VIAGIILIIIGIIQIIIIEIINVIIIISKIITKTFIDNRTTIKIRRTRTIIIAAITTIPRGNNTTKITLHKEKPHLGFSFLYY